MERVFLSMQSNDVVFLQNNCPINVHQAMTKEQKVSILFKGILGTKSPLKIQASLKHWASLENFALSTLDTPVVYVKVPNLVLPNHIA